MCLPGNISSSFLLPRAQVLPSVKAQIPVPPLLPQLWGSRAENRVLLPKAFDETLRERTLRPASVFSVSVTELFLYGTFQPLDTGR